jgi:hypothetical protein
MARRMTAPNKDISKAPIEKSPELIVGAPSNGDSKNPASAAPMIPTTIFKKDTLLSICPHDLTGNPAKDATDDDD